MYSNGDFVLEEGKFLTPHYVGKVMVEVEQIDVAPSVGAIHSVFKRWERAGIAKFRKHPYAFVAFADQEKPRLADLAGVVDR